MSKDDSQDCVYIGEHVSSSPPSLFGQSGLFLNMGFSSWYHSLRNSELTQGMDPAPLGINPELSSMDSDPLESWMCDSGKSLQLSEHLFCTLSNGHDNASFSEHCVSAVSSHVQGTWPRQSETHNKNCTFSALSSSCPCKGSPRFRGGR